MFENTFIIRLKHSIVIFFQLACVIKIISTVIVSYHINMQSNLSFCKLNFKIIARLIFRIFEWNNVKCWMKFSNNWVHETELIALKLFYVSIVKIAPMLLRAITRIENKFESLLVMNECPTSTYSFFRRYILLLFKGV